MTLILPTSTGSPISQWAVVDWATPTFVSQPAAAGVASIDCGVLDLDEQWLVDHMVAQCTSKTVTSMRLYDSSAAPQQLLDGTAAGNFDVADWPAGLLVRPQSSLLAVWTGCSAGAVATLRLQARLMRQVTA